MAAGYGAEMHHQSPGHHAPPPVGGSRAKALAATIAIVLGGLLVLAVLQAAFGSGVSTTSAVKSPTALPTALPTAKKTATPTPSPTRTRLTREIRETAFVLLVQNRRGFRDFGDDDLLRLGRAACKALDSGASIQVVALTLVTEGNVGPEDAGYFVGTAISGLCPRHKGKLPD